MRFLVLYAHPDPASFSSALHRTVVDTLRKQGHEVDDCDLYAERFDPVLSYEERASYHDVPANRRRVETYVRRLEAAEGLILVFPVWNFGFPAILKGFLDRVFLPGVSFRLEDGRVRPRLTQIRRLAAVTTYGADRLRAWLAGDPPRRLVMRVLRATFPEAHASYHALYDMNRADEARRRRFLDRVGTDLERF